MDRAYAPIRPPPRVSRAGHPAGLRPGAEESVTDSTAQFLGLIGLPRQREANSDRAKEKRMAGGSPSGHSTRLLGCRPGPSCPVRTSFTKKVCEHKPTEAASTQHAAADQQTHEPTVVGPALLVLTLVVIFLLAPFAQEMGEKQATQAPATRDAARDQEAHEPTLVGSALLVLALVLILVLILVLAPFAQEMSEKQAAQTPA